MPAQRPVKSSKGDPGSKWNREWQSFGLTLLNASLLTEIKKNEQDGQFNDDDPRRI